MSADEIRELVNAWVKAMMSDVVNFDLDTTKIPTLTWQESMDRFGTDKPDLRIAYELKDVSETVGNLEVTIEARTHQQLLEQLW